MIATTVVMLQLLIFVATIQHVVHNPVGKVR